MLLFSLGSAAMFSYPGTVGAGFFFVRAGAEIDLIPCRDPSTSSKSFGSVDYLLTAESGAEAIHFWAFMRTRS